jgi:hypothetical protein
MTQREQSGSKCVEVNAGRFRKLFERFVERQMLTI